MKDNWEKIELKSLLKEPIRDFGSFSMTNLINFQERGVPFLKSESIQNGYIDFSEISFISEEVHKLLYKSIVREGDILYTKIGAICRGAIYDGSIGVCNSNAATAKIKVNEELVSKYYILYYLLSDRTKREFEKSIISTPPRINLGDINKFIIALPPLPQQHKIAQILSTCDAVIEKTEAAKAKYQAIKKGLMHDLFTRGIDLKTGKLRPKYEDAPELYKESELGMIPKEWGVESIINSTYLKGRIGWQGLRAEEFIEDGPYLVTGTDFVDGKIDWSVCYHVTEARYNEAKYIQLKNDDFLITKDGTIGKTAYVKNCPEKAVLNSGIFLMRCKNDSYINKYVFHLLNSSVFDKYLYKTLGGSTIVHLYQREFEKFKFPLPPKNEQEKIIEEIDALIIKLKNEQSILSKYKQIKAGLMQDLLTGKVEVEVSNKN